MEIKSSEEAPQLDHSARSFLLRAAREAIAAALRGASYAPLREAPASLSEPGACFVSLHDRGGLRGCIGVLRALRPLAEAVAHCARAAAFEDPRFPPLTAAELVQVEIEISVLGVLRPLLPGEMPSPGVHGVLIAQGSREGLLLPQVAVEQGWSALQLLEETSLKAGLARDAWRRGAQTRVFLARVFSERELT